MASVLVIGIGTTGLAVMEEAQRFYYEFTKQNSPGNNTEFLFLDTTHSSAARNTNGQTAIKSCDITTTNVNASLTNWNDAKRPDWSWLPTTADMLDAAAGAGGQPVYGRVALWDNQGKVRQAVTNAYQRIGGDAATKIYLVGTLTGGTGTGVFIDVAYMVQQITNNTNVYGMLLLPSDADANQPTKSMMCENAYTSLKSLDYFFKSGNYQCTLPGGTPLTSPFHPFCNVQFFTCDYCNAAASMNLPQLIQSVGFNLVLRLLDVTFQSTPFQSVVDARVQADYMQSVPKGFFTTIGLNVFQYPEGLLEELFSLNLIKGLLERWTDISNFYDVNGIQKTIASVKPSLQVESRNYVEDLIDQLVSSSKGNAVLGSQSMKDEVKKRITTIIEKQYDGTEGRYVYSLFNPNDLGNLYSAITGQAGNMRNAIIDSLDGKINEIANKYQNANIIENYLNAFCTGVDRLLKFWKKVYQINGKPDQWTIVCGQYLDKWMNGSRHLYTAMGCKKEWWAELLMNMVNMCYYNALFVELEAICNAIKGVVGTVAFSNPNTGKTLPTIDELKLQKGRLLELLNPLNSTSVVCRINDIVTKLSNGAHPQFHYLFCGQSYGEDMKQATGKYNTLSNHLQLSDITPSLWDFWVNGQSPSVLRDKMVSKTLTFVQGLNLFGNVDVATIMTNLQSSHPKWNKVSNILNGTEAIIQGDTPAMVRLVPTMTFVPHNCLKLLVASDQSVGNGIAPSMRGYIPSTAANAQTYIQLGQMKNTVVVYQEYAYLGTAGQANNPQTFNPLTDLYYQNRVKDSIVSQGKAFNSTRLRLAYIDEKTLNNNQVNIR